ncbi:MAG: DNA/RNA nuclease SfsA [Alphaproteobacteria bacterium HGW-Alphaproteobacteria-1]|jgi:sugar fermentation stimulation protein A|nr:MAG: DNA/RNA nuclease SfsA [Alphaproteobacteria bacterium HGW-Alphaproteobacteria-1]
MRFQSPLLPAILIRRYKRFLADIRLDDGTEATAHCANPGSMMGLAAPGARIWLEPNDDPRKKLRYGWRLVEPGAGVLVCIDTGAANRVLRAALTARAIPELAAYDTVRPEQRYGEKSRVDFLLSGGGLPDAYVEVKSVTLSRQPGLAEFPDSVTARGTRHLHDLARVAQSGARAVLFYLVQRGDARALGVAADIDPAYAAALAHAQAAGVTILSYCADISRDMITIGHSLPTIAPRPLALGGK